MGVGRPRFETDRRATSMAKYRFDQWHDYKPSLLRRVIDRLRRR